jgi:perosamine synthetase
MASPSRETNVQAGPSKARRETGSLWFGSGRQASFALYRELRRAGTRSVWLPEFHCMSMVSPATAAGVAVRFYQVDEMLTSRLETLSAVQPHDAVVAVHYFGRAYDLEDIAELCAERGAILIEDAAHVEISSIGADGSVGRHGQYVLYCPRKFLPIYDGAVLVGPSAFIDDVAQSIPNVREQVKSLVALSKSRRYALGTTPPTAQQQVVPADYVEPRFALVATRATVASRIGWRWCFNKTRRWALRRRRFEAIHDAVQGSPAIRPLFTEIQRGATPYVYPALLADPRDFYKLRDAGINALRWEELAAEPSATIDRLYRSLVQLPCCDGMAERDFERLLQLLRKLGQA